MSIIDKIRADAALKCPRVVLPECHDLRILEAALEIDRLGIARPILLADQTELDALAREHKLDLSGIQCEDITQLAQSKLLRAQLRSRKWYQSLSEAALTNILQEPLALACTMLAAGEVDACVAGAVHSTSEVISRGLRIIGTREDSPLLSCFLLMAFHSPPVEGLEYALFSDCAINVNPDSEQLAQIAIATAQSAESLFNLEPKVALLSFSSAGSASHPDAEKVAQAKRLINQQAPGLKVIGEAQFDTALLPSIRQSKMPEAAFAKPANVYIFPNLDAGNIAYKVAERIGDAKVVGPILQGLKKPLNDLSRGADIEAIVNTIAMTCLQLK